MSVNYGTMRIGEVHAQLRKDFPDVELSKIRYYEDKGLVKPSRSRKGYRLYSERDVACLREAIRLAQEEFVPLRVVRLRLIEQGLLSENGVTPSSRQAAREATASVVAPAPSGAAAALARPALSVVGEVNETAATGSAQPSRPSPSVQEFLSAAELMATTGLSPEEFNQIQALGLVTPTTSGNQTVYRALDARVCAHARALLARGVDVRLLGTIRRIAEREAGVVDDVVSPLRQRVAERQGEDLAALISDVAREVTSLRAVLVERELGSGGA